MTDPLDEAALLVRLDGLVRSGRVRLEIDRRKLNSIDFPLLMEADGNLWAYGIAILVALAFWQGGIAAGIAAAIAGIVVYETAARAFILRRLDRRIRTQGLASLEHWRKLWRFGGVALVAEDGRRCQGPGQSWMALVRDLGP